MYTDSRVRFCKHINYAFINRYTIYLSVIFCNKFALFIQGFLFFSYKALNKVSQTFVHWIQLLFIE